MRWVFPANATASVQEETIGLVAATYSWAVQGAVSGAEASDVVDVVGLPPHPARRVRAMRIEAMYFMILFFR
jgi:hypothetical protein